MFIDFLFGILMVMAVFKGYSRGFVVAVFSFIAFFIGLIAAIKLSASVADWLTDRSGSTTVWMPFIAFILVMALVMLLIRLGAKLIEKMMGFVMLGWLNKLGGILFFAILYIMLFSIVLFYAENLGVLTDETINTSGTYGFIAPLGPKVIDAIGAVIPIFKGLFEQLETFFDTTNEKISKMMNIMEPYLC